MERENLITKLNFMSAAGLNVSCRHFILLMFDFGLRINDMRKIRREDITSSGIIIVKQSKGSLPLTCRVNMSDEFWCGYRSGYYDAIALFSYSFFYKLFKRYGLSIYNGIDSNASVTHVARKLLAQEIYTVDNDIVSVASALGHKKTSSSLYYLTAEQRNNEVKRGILTAPAGVVDRFKINKRNGRDFIYLK